MKSLPKSLNKFKYTRIVLNKKHNVYLLVDIHHILDIPQGHALPGHGQDMKVTFQ